MPGSHRFVLEASHGIQQSKPAQFALCSTLHRTATICRTHNTACSLCIDQRFNVDADCGAGTIPGRDPPYPAHRLAGVKWKRNRSRLPQGRPRRRLLPAGATRCASRRAPAGSRASRDVRGWRGGSWPKASRPHRRYPLEACAPSAELERLDRFFDRFAWAAAFIGRVLPGVRSFISLPAGIAHMPFVRFQIYTFAGSLPWCFVFAYLGYVLGQAVELQSGSEGDPEQLRLGSCRLRGCAGCLLHLWALPACQEVGAPRALFRARASCA